MADILHASNLRQNFRHKVCKRKIPIQVETLMHVRTVVLRMLLAFSQPVNCIFWPIKTQNWLAAASKLHSHWGTGYTAEWPYCPLILPSDDWCCRCCNAIFICLIGTILWSITLFKITFRFCQKFRLSNNLY